MEVAPSPKVHRKDIGCSFRIGGAGAGEVDRKRRRAFRRCRGCDGHRRQIGFYIADTAEFAHTERAADIRIAKVEIVECSLGTFGQIDDVAIRTVDGAVKRLEVKDASHITGGVERQAANPILRVVGKEVASLEAAGELRPVIDKPARNS